MARIQELTGDLTWLHVPSEEKPADILSRGSTVNELMNNNLWWNGPSWLRESSQRPIQMQNLETNLPETRTTNVVLTSTLTLTSSLLTRYSSFGKLCRIIAYCYEFIGKRLNLTMENEAFQVKKVNRLVLNKVEKVVLRWVQEESFSSDLQQLKRGQPLSSKNPLISLTPFIDHEGLIRVGGRMKNAEEQKHPIVLASNHYITGLIMREVHEKLLRCPPE